MQDNHTHSSAAAAPAHGADVERKDIPAACKWRVTDIYPDDEAWQEACRQVKELLPLLSALQGELTNGKAVLAALRLQDDLGRRLDKIYAYCGLQNDADTTDQSLQSLRGQADSLVAAYANANSFIEPELLALGAERVEAMFAEEPELEEYRHYIENLLRLSGHILSAAEEALFAKGRLSRCSAANAFRSLTNADMVFPPITDGAGRTASVSNGNYLLHMTSPDRELRKNAFQTLHNTYHNYRNTLAATLTGSAQTAYYYAEVHNYRDTLASCLAEDNIPESLYDGLIQTVHDNLAPLHEYMQLKKNVLGVEELHPYDIYLPLSPAGAADSFACSFPQACAKVKEALAPLGEEYLAALQQGLDGGWIDVYENKGKRSGAYSWGVFGVHPYVLLNFQPRYNSISTLAHEMGHAMHSYFSSASQSFINSEYTIFCAEIASTCNEILLLEYNLQHADDGQKIFLLNQFLEAVRTTVYRQTQFAEFEKFIHGEITAGRSLQAQTLEETWLQSNRDYYGPALTADRELAAEWSRIPHFYTPFYVYKYATGYAAATAFATAILNKEPGAVEKYLGFLHAGGSDYSLNILKRAGVDLTTPQPVTVTLKKFAEKLAELKLLLKRS